MTLTGFLQLWKINLYLWSNFWTSYTYLKMNLNFSHLTNLDSHICQREFMWASKFTKKNRNFSIIHSTKNFKLKSKPDEAYYSQRCVNKFNLIHFMYMYVYHHICVTFFMIIFHLVYTNVMKYFRKSKPLNV